MAIVVKVLVAFKNYIRKWRAQVNEAPFVFGVQSVCELWHPALQCPCTLDRWPWRRMHALWASPTLNSAHVKKSQASTVCHLLFVHKVGTEQTALAPRFPNELFILVLWFQSCALRRTIYHLHRGVMLSGVISVWIPWPTKECWADWQWDQQLCWQEFLKKEPTMTSYQQHAHYQRAQCEHAS